MYKVNKQLVESVKRIKRKHKELISSGMSAKVQRELEYAPILESLQSLQRGSAPADTASYNENMISPKDEDSPAASEEQQSVKNEMLVKKTEASADPYPLFSSSSKHTLEPQHRHRKMSSSSLPTGSTPEAGSRIRSSSVSSLSAISPKQFYTSPTSSPRFVKEMEKLGPVAIKYLNNYYLKPIIVDKTYGLRRKEEGFFLGNSKVVIVGNDLVIQGEKYTGTPGLWELLTLKTPSDYTDKDLAIYSTLVRITNAHKQNYESEGRPLSSIAIKYKQIIKQIVDEDKTGGGFTHGKTYPDDRKTFKRNREVDYIYWNDINELVERYIVLCLAENAGNNSVQNEKASIIAELKEEGVIS